jgi:acylphosphatase
MSEELVSIRHVIVRGRVQGVGYRAWTEYAARKLGLGGWVRNRRDGTVEAVFTGPAHLVGRMVEQCRRGPPASWVDAVDHREGNREDLALRRDGEDFSVLPTL